MSQSIPDNNPDLPCLAEQVWLQNQLRCLIERAGPGPFLAEPLAESHPEADEAVGELLGALMTRASMAGSAELVIDPVSSDEHGRAGCWFVDATSDLVRYAWNGAGKGAESARCLAREVVRAWRVHHDLDGDTEPPEAVFQLSMLYLGFGGWVVDDAAGADSFLGWTISEGQTIRPGALPHRAWVYAAALRSAARGRTGALPSDDQPDAVRRAALDVIPDRDMLLARLGLPDSEDHDADKPAVKVSVRRATKKSNLGRPVFQLTCRRISDVTYGLMVMALLMIPVGHVSLQAPEVAWPVGILAIAAIAWFGPRAPYTRCSDVDCDAVISKHADYCPDCGGEVRGVIDSRSELAEAEAQL